MKAERIPLYDLTLSRRAIREVTDTLSSGWLTTGPKVREFEKAAASYLGVPYTAALSSATAGLTLSLKTAGVGGREVITSPFTFIATVEAILRSGGTPVFADIDPETLNIDPRDVAGKISKRTACILPVDIAGYPADYRQLRRLARQHAVSLLADSAHSFGAVYRGKSMARLADAVVFSFQATKNLTCGEGGMVASRSKSFVERIRLLSLHGLSAGAYQRRLKRRWEYDVSDLGFKANLSDVHAAIGLGQMAEFGRNQARRTAIAGRYVRNLDALGDYLALPRPVSWVSHAWHLFIIRLHLSRLSIDRNRFIALMARRGVECGVHYRPVFAFSFYRRRGLSERRWPNAARAGRCVVSLPMYPGLKMAQVDYICDSIAEIVMTHAR